MGRGGEHLDSKSGVGRVLIMSSALINIPAFVHISAFMCTSLQLDQLYKGVFLSCCPLHGLQWWSAQNSDHFWVGYCYCRQAWLCVLCYARVHTGFIRNIGVPVWGYLL